MAKEKLLLINLNEEKTKKISEIISSNTSRKILDYLADKDDTEANISKNIKLPISTVHYHIQKLMQARLVVVDEFHYSKKGREVNHYKLANKYIIIAPKKVKGIKQALKNVLPAALAVLGISAIIKFVSSSFTSMKAGAPEALFKAEQAATTGAERVMEESVTAAAEGTADAAAPVAETITEATPLVADKPDIALWFLIGSFATILIYIIIALIENWRKR